LREGRATRQSERLDRNSIIVKERPKEERRVCGGTGDRFEEKERAKKSGKSISDAEMAKGLLIRRKTSRGQAGMEKKNKRLPKGPLSDTGSRKGSRVQKGMYKKHH